MNNWIKKVYQIADSYYRYFRIYMSKISSVIQQSFEIPKNFRSIQIIAKKIIPNMKTAEFYMKKK